MLSDKRHMSVKHFEENKYYKYRILDTRLISLKKKKKKDRYIDRKKKSFRLKLDIVIYTYTDRIDRFSVRTNIWCKTSREKCWRERKSESELIGERVPWGFESFLISNPILPIPFLPQSPRTPIAAAASFRRRGARG